MGVQWNAAHGSGSAVTLTIHLLCLPPGTHSLRYFRLGISDPGHEMPEFISVGYVDSYPITTYDSVSRQKELRAPWMAENLAPDHWERYTQLLRGWQQTFKAELKQLQRHYNHSGGEGSGVNAFHLQPPSK